MVVLELGQSGTKNFPVGEAGVGLDEKQRANLLEKPTPRKLHVWDSTDLLGLGLVCWSDKENLDTAFVRLMSLVTPETSNWVLVGGFKLGKRLSLKRLRLVAQSLRQKSCVAVLARKLPENLVRCLVEQKILPLRAGRIRDIRTFSQALQINIPGMSTLFNAQDQERFTHTLSIAAVVEPRRFRYTLVWPELKLSQIDEFMKSE
ncbi:hypothetical protein KW782_03715 [Candidatus Parcubacteria bacterium]|nr:hypothetical protein [Candidatus Parcubacteria bacterium]